MSHPNHFLIAIALSFFVSGVVESLVSINNQQSIALIHILILAFLFFGWCKAHVRFSEITEPSGSAIMCGLFGAIGIPLYFFRAFGAKQGFIKTLRSIFFFIFCVLIYIVTTSLIA